MCLPATPGILMKYDKDSSKTRAAMRKVLCEFPGDCDLITNAMINVACCQDAAMCVIQWGNIALSHERHYSESYENILIRRFDIFLETLNNSNNYLVDGFES